MRFLSHRSWIICFLIGAAAGLGAWLPGHAQAQRVTCNAAAYAFFDKHYTAPYAIKWQGEIDVTVVLPEQYKKIVLAHVAELARHAGFSYKANQKKTDVLITASSDMVKDMTEKNVWFFSLFIEDEQKLKKYAEDLAQKKKDALLYSYKEGKLLATAVINLNAADTVPVLEEKLFLSTVRTLFPGMANFLNNAYDVKSNTYRFSGRDKAVMAAYYAPTIRFGMSPEKVRRAVRQHLGC